MDSPTPSHPPLRPPASLSSTSSSFFSFFTLLQKFASLLLGPLNFQFPSPPLGGSRPPLQDCDDSLVYLLPPTPLTTIAPLEGSK